MDSSGSDSSDSDSSDSDSSSSSSSYEYGDNDSGSSSNSDSSLAPSPSEEITEEDEFEPSSSSCPCDDENSGGSQTQNGSVDLSIIFGRFPSFPGFSAGKVTLHSNSLVPLLIKPASLRFEHIIERKVDSIETSAQSFATPAISILTQKGYHRYACKNDSIQNRNNVVAKSNLRKVGGSQIKKEEVRAINTDGSIFHGDISNAPLFEEALEDGTLIRYSNPSGVVHSIKPFAGNWVTREQIEEELKIIRIYDPSAEDDEKPNIIDSNAISMKGAYLSTHESIVTSSMRKTKRRSANSIRQIWNRTDGLLDITPITSGTPGFKISWYAASDVSSSINSQTGLYDINSEAEVIKTWTITGITERVVIPESSNYSYIDTNYKCTPVSSPKASGDTSKKGLSVMTGGRVETVLRQLDITEQRGDLGFRSRWKAVNDYDLLYIRGEGEEAEACLKTTESLTLFNPSGNSYIEVLDTRKTVDVVPASAYRTTGGTLLAESVMNRSDAFMSVAMRPDGRAILGNTSTPGEKIVTTGIAETKRYFKGENTYSDSINWANIPHQYIKTVTHRFEFGDVVTRVEEGNPEGQIMITSHNYEHNPEHRNYGQRVKTTRPDSSVVEMNYDASQRMIMKTEPWAGGGQKTTRYTYCDVHFNDRRIASTTEMITTDNGEEYQLIRQTFVYDETPAVYRITTVTAALGAQYDAVTVSEWYGTDPQQNGAASLHAIGRPKLVRGADGVEQTFTYEDTADFNADYKCIMTKTVNGAIIPGKSTQTITYYNNKGEITCEQEFVHVNQTNSSSEQ